MSDYSPLNFEQIVSAFQAAYQNALAEADVKRGSDIYARIRVWAALLEGLYQYLSWTGNQIFPDTAATASLEHHAALYGLSREPASVAEGTVLMRGTPASSLPAGLTLQDVSGVQLTNTAAGTFGPDGTVTVPAVTLTAGIAANLLANNSGVDNLTVLDPPANVQSTASTASAFTGGADVESDAALLARLLDRLRQPPAGGNAHDYKVWAEAIAGVATAYVYPLRRGLGTVDVIVTASGGNRIPAAELLANVQAAIDAVRPCTAKDFEAIAPTPVPVDVTVSVTAASGFGGDWTGTKTVASGSTTSLINVDSTAGLSALSRVVINEEERFIQSILSGTQFGLTEPLSSAPSSGAVVYPGGPLWQGIYDALRGLLGAEPPPIYTAGASYPITRTLYLSKLIAAVSSISGVLDVALSKPTANVVTTVDASHQQMVTPGAIIITFA
jgi:uncharacterized phage protein gp47/JayE